jgi:hypothetical protein
MSDFIIQNVPGLTSVLGVPPNPANSIIIGLTSYTTTVSTSPALTLAGAYQVSATQWAEDSWTFADAVTPGTNGPSTLNISHSGTSGALALAIAAETITLATLGSSGNCLVQCASNLGLKSTGGGLIQLIANSDTITYNGGIFSMPSASKIGSANSDLVGTLTSTGSTSVTKTFGTAYTSAPSVLVTPTSNCGNFWVAATATTSFTVQYATSGTQTFNYRVWGNPS